LFCCSTRCAPLSPEEEGALLSALRNVTIIDRFPGMVLVDGTDAELAAVVRAMPHWRYAPAGSAEINQPPPFRPHPL
jgi:hypothetical protein